MTARRLAFLVGILTVAAAAAVAAALYMTGGKGPAAIGAAAVPGRWVSESRPMRIQQIYLSEKGKSNHPAGKRDKVPLS